MASTHTIRLLLPAGGYLVLWAATLLMLRTCCEFGAVEAVFGLVVLGFIFPCLAWLTTRRIKPLDNEVRAPGRETAVLILYLAPVAAVLAYGFGLVARITAEPLHTLVLLTVKLAVFVAVPTLLLGIIGGYRLSDLAPLSLRRPALVPALWMGMAAVAMQAVLGRGLTDLLQAHIPAGVLAVAVPLCFAFLAVEAGVVEEFFFRALLQERLAAYLRSPWGGVVLSAVLFGLVHAPGLYLRPAATLEAVGTHPSLLMAVGYSMVMTSVAGVFLGVLWMRTRNFAVVVLTHAAVDLLPGLVPWVRAFHLT